MKYYNSIISSINKNNSKLISIAILLILIVVLVNVVIITIPLMTAVAQDNSIEGWYPGITPPNNKTETMTTKSFPSANTNTNITAATVKPVDGYNTPQGHLSAIRYVFNDPALRVQRYCKPNEKIVLVCQLYDSDLKNATLIGIEYIITTEQYNSLPNREKPDWHYHKI